jgi:uncharacterized protein YqkB
MKRDNNFTLKIPKDVNKKLKPNDKTLLAEPKNNITKEDDNESIFNTKSFLPINAESLLPEQKKKDDKKLRFNLKPFLPEPKQEFYFSNHSNIRSPDIPSQFRDTGDDVIGVTGAERVTSPNGGLYFRKPFYEQEYNDKKIDSELFGYLLYHNFYKTFYNKDILNIRIEDMSQSPKLISKDIENFETLWFLIDDSGNDIDDIGGNKFASDVVNDIGDKDFNKKLVDIMLLSEIMMFSDLNNSGNIGLKDDQDNIIYPVIIDFLTHEETELNIQYSNIAQIQEPDLEIHSNNLIYFLDPGLDKIKKIINCDNNIDEYTNVPFFYYLLIHSLAKENIDPEWIANKIKTLSTDALNNNFFKDDSKFYTIIKNSFAELRDISVKIRKSNQRNISIAHAENKIIDAITMFFDINKTELQNHSIDFEGCVEKIEGIIEVVKSETPKHNNKIIECRPPKPINAWSELQY